MKRHVVVTIDTEVDKDATWRISDPPRFSSIVNAVPRVFSPLFERHGVRPTYFLSPEVIEHAESARTLAALGDSAELATHLHAELVGPERRLTIDNMGGKGADAIQKQYPRDVEAAKLATLTTLFRDTFGSPPVSFRAGRYGMSEHTHELLAGLGYRVDSSVTPGLCWRYEEGTLDFRDWKRGPQWVSTPAGRLFELPLSVMPRAPLALVERIAPAVARRIIDFLGDSRSYEWLRPSWRSGRELVSYVERSNERFLVLMLHSIEVVAGASPYAASEAAATRIVKAMDELFAHCRARGIGFCTVGEAAALA